MTISDQSRYDLHQRLAEVLGADEAATLMEHLPPTSWADVATKRDLDVLGRELELKIEASESRLRAEIHLGNRSVFFAVIGSNAAMAALALTAAALR